MSDSQDRDRPSRPGLTTERTVRRQPGDGGYRRLGIGPGECHTRLGDAGEAADGTAETVLRLVQVSDFQLADFTSPTRLEFLQRIGDEPTWAQMVPSYRPQEFAAVAQVEALARTVRALAEAGRPADLVLTTGDNTDNQQVNELDQFIALMSGGARTRSFPPDTRPGTGTAGDPDPAYYHPDPEVADEWKDTRGFPGYARALRDSAREFVSTGFGVRWLACFGNHDALVQGRAPGSPGVAALLAGEAKPVLLDEATRAATDASDTPAMELYQHDPARFSGGPTAPVAADPDRRLFDRARFVAATRGADAAEAAEAAEAGGVAYFADEPHPAVRLLVLDTTNPGGHVDGSLGTEQFRWLRAQLDGALASDQLVVVASHHGLSTMTNGYVARDESGAARPGQDLPRVLGPEIEELLLSYPNVALWLSGHTHRNRVGAVGPDGQGFWQVSTSATIDWPCQARLVEIAVEGDHVLLRLTMLDHLAHAAPGDEDSPLLRVAAAGREIAANILDGVGGDRAEGATADRNVELTVRVPDGVLKALADRRP
ncbi:metallophosphoesterase [Streptomyces odontomachi]|uniref:metallophosphoesterase n=1 Tax=Streptomyces odontomachi TaxID=2944940 RepID=UPI00210EDE84|nr:metallophosphoesterase [Streptomyces sp. ODS25]